MHMTAFLTFKLKHPAQAISVLEAGVEHLISKFPFLTGNVATNSPLWCKKNALHVHPTTPALLEQYPMLKIKYHPRRYLFSQPNQVPGPAVQEHTVSYDVMFNEDYLPLPLDNSMAEESPIFRLQANALEDGIILCVTFHHMAMDGKGLESVMEVLSLCCQDPDKIVLPDMIPTSAAKEGLTRKQILDAASAVNPALPVINEEARDSEVPAGPNIQIPITRKLVLCDSKITQLQEICMTLAKAPTMLSRNDIISAILWLCAMRARALISPNTQGTSRLVTAIDVRTILPVIPQSYMGNAMQVLSIESPFPVDATVKTLPGLLDNPSTVGGMRSPLNETDIPFLTQLALAIRRGLTLVDEKSVRENISRIVDKPDWQSNDVTMGHIMQSSLRKMKIYKLDFGTVLGKIYDFDNPDPRLNGLAWVLPARFEGAPWEVRMALEPEVMELVRRDSLFRWVEYKEVSRI
jgi:fumigaclavine B O-acetyltransferase